MDRCKNCNIQLHGPICHQCGQRQRVAPWTTRELLSQFFSQLTNIEKGFWYTAIALLNHPGTLIREYWNGRTIRAYNPFRYVLIWTAINLLISFWLGFDDLLQQQLQPESVVDQFGEERIADADQKFDTWLNALILLLIPFFAGLTYWFFRKARKNYAEHLILNAFIMGQQSFITSFSHFLFFFFPSLFVIYIPFNFLVGLGYNSYVFRRVFLESWPAVLLKALLIGVLGMLAYFGVVALASAAAIWLS